MHGLSVAILENRLGEHLIGLVEKRGAKPFWAPALAEEPDVDPPAIRAMVEAFARMPPHMAIFQTGVGTKALFAACDAIGVSPALLQALSAATVVVRGPKPTVELRKRAVRIDLSAAEPYTTAQILDAIAEHDLRGKNVLVQRYGETNAELDEALQRRGAHVIEVPTYRWALPHDTQRLVALMDALRRSEIDVVIFTSASQVKNLFAVAAQRADQLREDLQRTLVASIGPACTRALAASGVAAGLEASPPKLGPLLFQLAVHFSGGAAK
mgnify:CR=1 FL=1